MNMSSRLLHSWPYLAQSLKDYTPRLVGIILITISMRSGYRGTENQRGRFSYAHWLHSLWRAQTYSELEDHVKSSSSSVKLQLPVVPEFVFHERGVAWG